LASRTADLLIVGGGHAVFPVLQRVPQWFERFERLRIVLISEYPLFFYSGMVPEFLGGVYSKSQICLDLKQLCTRIGVEFVADRVVSLDPDAKSVTTKAGATYKASLMLFDVGSRPPKMPAQENVAPVKPLQRLDELEQFLDRHLYAPDTQEMDKEHLVIVGGGAAGVELAMNISSRLRAHQRQHQLKITLLEAGDQLLTEYPEGMGEYVADQLRQRGVELRLKRSAVSVGEQQIKLDDQHVLDYDYVVWATGTVGQPFFRESGLECDDRDFLWMDKSLQHPRHPWLMAAGDCVRINQYPALRKIGVHAVKQGPVLATNVERLLRTHFTDQDLDSVPLLDFKPYAINPTILSTGSNQGIWSTEKFWFRHPLMLRLKHFLDLRWIEQYYSRSMPSTNWMEKLHLRNATSSG
jgi:NADH dehydrogenase FAD-containing subunit